MSRFNSLSGITATPGQMAAHRASLASRGSSPLRSASATPDTLTHEGGAAYTRDARADLYLLTLSGLVAEDSFYESGSAKMARVRELVTRIVADDASENRADSGAWLADFVRWMRTEGNIRTGAILTAAEAVHARLTAGAHSFNREIVSGALDRADEPGEFVAYWLNTFGTAPNKAKTLPKPVKRGLADAAVRLYNEFAVLRYDTGSHGVRFGDVVDLVQPRTNSRTPVEAQNGDLLRHLIDRRHAYNTSDIPESLTMLRTRAELEAVPVEARRPIVEAAASGDAASLLRLRGAGMTWEWLASWVQGPMDATAWKVALSSIGYMAALRNLRNLDEAGIDDATAQVLADRLADPGQVAKSRQLPYRFLSAYEAVGSDRWRVALGKALDASTQNIPELEGSLILVDTSASMSTMGWSAKSKMTPVRTAALFGVALATRSRTSTLCGFADGTFEHQVRGGVSVLREVERFSARIGEVGHGTAMVEAIQARFVPGKHRRVILISDEQAFDNRWSGNPSTAVPADVPLYAFNLGGNAPSVIADEPNRHQLGGLTDHTFRMIPLIEAGIRSGFPWEIDD
jgi:hypothetical protein